MSAAAIIAASVAIYLLVLVVIAIAILWWAGALAPRDAAHEDLAMPAAEIEDEGQLP